MHRSAGVEVHGGGAIFFRLLHTESTLLHKGLKNLQKFAGVGNKLLVFITKFLAFEGEGGVQFCASGGSTL